LFLASALIPAGLFGYGWSAQMHVHWAVADLCIAIFALGHLLCIQATVLYLIDTYTLYAASALAASSFLRSLAAFAVPLAGPVMLQRLGIGWSSAVLGLVCVGIGIPAPWLFWLYGEKVRQRSSMAKH
jgi:hypothetical protein